MDLPHTERKENAIKEDTININNAINKFGLQYQSDTDKLMRTIEGNLKIQ
jgi:hypothetical protein